MSFNNNIFLFSLHMFYIIIWFYCVTFCRMLIMFIEAIVWFVSKKNTSETISISFVLYLSDRTDSNSLGSLSTESNKQPTTTTTTAIPNTPIKPNVPVYQPVTRDHRSATIAKCSTATNEKPNSSLRETLDELNRLSNRIDHTIDNEQNR